MNVFSISQLSQFSGIKPHTIRIWEQRYNALEPIRSEGNTRYYDGKQLRRLLNIVSLMEKGFKVSQLCAMTDEKLNSLILDPDSSFDGDSADYFINQIIAAGMAFDSVHFEHIFSLSISVYGLKDTYKKVIHPVMKRIGLMWATDVMPAANEHFICNLFHQKISSAIDSLPLPDLSKESWLLLLPENDFHELPLLYASLLIRLSGRRVIYLGSNVPLISLKSTLEDTLPDNLLMFLIHFDYPERIEKDIEKINASFFGKKIYLAGNHRLISSIKFPENVVYLQSTDDIEDVLGLNKDIMQKAIK
ncbi:MAG: MerR family transcriptional regulator [Bacteroidetes bacterium]|nr:MerR family transcriptional regulator [Bacteroidota bacterium]